MPILRTRSARIAAAILLVLAAFVIGRFTGSPGPSTQETEASPGAETASEWTCSMHPQVRRPGPGLCPICAMDLIPVSAGGDGGGGPRSLSVTPASAALMRVETAPVERRFVEADIRLVGTVDYDETKQGYITAWVPGRLDRLYVDYTGVRVNEGDHMVYLYSPELLTTQEELRRAAESVRRAESSGSGALSQAAAVTLEAARNKLRRWGLTDKQLDEAQRGDGPSDHITIYAPMGGTVIEKNAQEGMYVETGTTIYTIADLSEVWVLLDAYETDLPWIHYGQRVTFTSDALPGETREGRIAFIDPVVNPDTRTARVRVNAANPDGKLRPGMFVRAVVTAQVATKGRVMDAALAGKWISPMHPEIVKDGPGACDICGMALVPAEDLGYVPAGATDADAPLVIPASAPLITGKRAVVYVLDDSGDAPLYTGREIALGPRAGDSYIVEAGLEEGERVVTHGNFKIDSALQIQAKTSMMQPEERPDTVTLDHDAATAWTGVIDRYLTVQAALTESEFDVATAAWDEWLAALSAAGAAMTGGARDVWHDSGLAAIAAGPPDKGSDIEALRAAFGAASPAMIGGAKAFGAPTDSGLNVVHCPMALGPEGADWLQRGTEVMNPYLPETMLHCGNVVQPVPASPAMDHRHE